LFLHLGARTLHRAECCTQLVVVGFAGEDERLEPHRDAENNGHPQENDQKADEAALARIQVQAVEERELHHLPPEVAGSLGLADAALAGAFLPLTSSGHFTSISITYFCRSPPTT